MCGRYYIDIDDKELKDIIKEVRKNLYDDFKTGEIFPTNIAPIYIDDNNKMKPILAKWGFPKWDGKGVIINARVEAINEKAIFKKIFTAKRCIVPASGYFEWKKDNTNNKKYKYKFTKHNSILYMAGLYNEVILENKNKQLSLFDNDEKSRDIYYSIITKQANSSVSNIHDRMPLIFCKKDIHKWLNGNNLNSLIVNNNTV